MFIWTSLAHVLLPLGESGIQEIRNEQAVLSPGMGLGPNATMQHRIPQIA